MNTPHRPYAKATTPTPLTAFAEGRLMESLCKCKWFNICTLKELMQLRKRQHMMGSKEYAALQPMHCIHWDDMPDEIQAEVGRLVKAVLGL